MKKGSKKIFLSVALIAVIAAVFFSVKNLIFKPDGPSAFGDMVIQKSGVTSTPSFYPYKIDGTKMEVIAVKASDGTVRTAFNTCQVCYSSGRGYYKPDGDTLVCQNCGNRFAADQVEVQKGGCNPIGITKDYKEESDLTITLKKSFFEQTRQIFANWKN